MDKSGKDPEIGPVESHYTAWWEIIDKREVGRCRGVGSCITEEIASSWVRVEIEHEYQRGSTLI